MTAEFIEHIEDFLNGKLSRQELEQMAAEQGITNLDEEIQWLEDSILGIQAAGLREQLKEVLPKPQQKKGRIRSLKGRTWIMTIAASLLLIVVAYFGLLRGDNPGLYAQFEYVDPGLPVLMSQSEDHLLYDAMSYYGEGNYAVAEEKLLQIQEDYKGNDTILYYLGASQLYQGKIPLANNQLQQIANNQNSRFQQRAEWLLVLATLKSKSTEETQQLLKLILEDEKHDFYQKAQELQQKLSQ